MTLLLALTATTAIAGDFVYDGTVVKLHAPGVGVVWPLDVAIIGVTGTAFFTLDPLAPRRTDRVFDPPDSYNPHWNPGAAIPSDFFGHPLKFHSEALFTNGPALSVLGMGITGGVMGGDVRSGIADGLLVVESITTTGALSVSGKHFFNAPRPITSTEFQEAFPKEWASEEVQQKYGPDDDYEAFKSFPSGHTASAGAAYFSAATLLWMHTGDRKPNATFWIAEGTAAALTATTGALRVHYGVHTVADVTAGGLLGGTIGFVIPVLHGGFDPDRQANTRLEPTENGVALKGFW